MRTFNTKSKRKKRLNQRKPYAGHIFFVSKNGFNEGWLKNYSRSGLFISTTASLSVGEIITIAIPYVNGKKIKCRGQIVRRTKEGFGIEFFKRRDALNLKIIK
ncbi:MAG: PilZ domain-containing protein [Desulfobacterales bacterium]|jgi:hypothetical protein